MLTRRVAGAPRRRPVKLSSYPAGESCRQVKGIPPSPGPAAACQAAARAGGGAWGGSERALVLGSQSERSCFGPTPGPENRKKVQRGSGEPAMSTRGPFSRLVSGR